MNKIPQPKMFGPLGNLPLIDAHNPIQSLMALAKENGSIYRFTIPNSTSLIISGGDLVADACDESRFDKKIGPALQKLRVMGGDGLFTSATDEPNWHKAHGILLSSFSQRAMEGYHTMMLDVTTQLIQKWQRMNPDETISVTDDMTRLTFDTIGLCGFSYRFNSFYQEKPHPFVESMINTLHTTLQELFRVPLYDKLLIGEKRAKKRDLKKMFGLVDSLIKQRRANPKNEENDLLARMLYGKDPETGLTLSDENIRYQIITFLIAGHETTSGLLSFALYFLLKNPKTLKKAYEEVDQIFSKDVPTYQDVRDLKYVRMILQEALRLWPTAPAFSLYPKQDTLLASKYPVKIDDTLIVLIPSLHRDKEVWGQNADEFYPERFVDQSKIPENTYKPFGNGQRACIGQQFAMQEATLVLGMILKHFTFIDHTNYQLKVKETLTLKPDGFTLQVRPRKQSVTYEKKELEKESNQKERVSSSKHETPFLVLYGSNLGTAELIARQLADEAADRGFIAEVGPLNSFVNKLPEKGLVVIVCASYNGNPPDNAKSFVQSLKNLEKNHDLKNIHYAVFGCGDRSWSDTYQNIPRSIDTFLLEKGAKNITQRGEGDASSDFNLQFERWREQFWVDTMAFFKLDNYVLSNTKETKLHLSYIDTMIKTPGAIKLGAYEARVLENRELQNKESGRSTRHIELLLPEYTKYQEGDHLGVLPKNSEELVARILNRFHLDSQKTIILDGQGRSIEHLPINVPIAVTDLLNQYVELHDVVTRSQIELLINSTQCPPHKKELEQVKKDDIYQEQILKKRVTLLELLEKYLSCELPFERFIEMLPPLKPRYYSVSSSPLMNKQQVSITVGIIREPALSGNGEYYGVASSYLSRRVANDTIAVFLETPQSNFQLPKSSKTPLIMIGPGTGIAPFRGFIQTRSIWKKNGKPLSEAHLYFGCRNPEYDFLYHDELQKYEKEGVVTIHSAFSRKPGQKKTYVQDLIRKDIKNILALLEQGGKLYICGDGKQMLPDVERMLCEAYSQTVSTTLDNAKEWLYKLQEEGSYAKDVWAG